MFQYKIIHNILATNVSLFRAKIRVMIYALNVWLITGGPSSQYEELYCVFYFYANVQRNVTWDIYYIT